SLLHARPFQKPLHADATLAHQVGDPCSFHHKPLSRNQTSCSKKRPGGPGSDRLLAAARMKQPLVFIRLAPFLTNRSTWSGKRLAPHSLKVGAATGQPRPFRFRR